VLLRVENLTIRFPIATPVHDLSFDIYPREVLGIVGESGSGKSLTALALIRLLPKTARISAGSVIFEGRDLLGVSEPEMRRLRGRDIGIVFQDSATALNPVLTVGRQIIEVLRLHKWLSARAARSRALELLDLVRLPDPHRSIDDYPHRLSGGARQRVMIAIALAGDPKLLIADEPTSSLDAAIQSQLLDLLVGLRRDRQMAVILISHNIGLVGQWADRVVVVYAGRKVEVAPPDELFRAPLHPYTRGLLAASSKLSSGYRYTDGPLPETLGSIASSVGEAGCLFRPRCPIARQSCGDSTPEMLAPAPGRLVACPFTALPEGGHHSATLGL
jgi:peptide/nickel transport system ATP-binding protein